MRHSSKTALRLATVLLVIGLAGCKITSAKLGPGGESPVQTFGVTSFPAR